MSCASGFLVGSCGDGGFKMGETTGGEKTKDTPVLKHNVKNNDRTYFHFHFVFNKRNTFMGNERDNSYCVDTGYKR